MGTEKELEAESKILSAPTDPSLVSTIPCFSEATLGCLGRRRRYGGRFANKGNWGEKSTEGYSRNGTHVTPHQEQPRGVGRRLKDYTKCKKQYVQILIRIQPTLESNIGEARDQQTICRSKVPFTMPVLNKVGCPTFVWSELFPNNSCLKFTNARSAATTQSLRMTRSMCKAKARTSCLQRLDEWAQILRGVPIPCFLSKEAALNSQGDFIRGHSGSMYRLIFQRTV